MRFYLLWRHAVLLRRESLGRHALLRSVVAGRSTALRRECRALRSTIVPEGKSSINNGPYKRGRKLTSEGDSPEELPAEEGSPVEELPEEHLAEGNQADIQRAEHRRERERRQ